MFTNTSRPFVGWGLSRRAVVATTTVGLTDRGYTIDATSGTYDIALTAAATLGAGFSFGVYNSGSGVVTINPNGAETIRSPAGSAATLALSQGQGVLVMCDGTGFDVVADSGLAPTAGSVISGLTTGRIVDAASATTVETAATITTDQNLRLSNLTASRVMATDTNKQLDTPATVTTGQAWAFTSTVTVLDNNLTILGNVDNTKKTAWQVDTQGAGFTLTWDVGAQTASRTLAVPALAGNDTLATLAVANIFTALQTVSIAGDAITLAGGMRITDPANTNKVIVIGVNSALSQYFIQPAQLGTAYTTLSLNPSGGDVAIGSGGLGVAGKTSTAASTTGNAGLNLPHGAAPSSPVNGDMWTTTAGLYVRINGVSVGPLS